MGNNSAAVTQMLERVSSDRRVPGSITDMQLTCQIFLEQDTEPRIAHDAAPTVYQWVNMINAHDEQMAHQSDKQELSQERKNPNIVKTCTLSPIYRFSLHKHVPTTTGC